MGQPTDNKSQIQLLKRQQLFNKFYDQLNIGQRNQLQDFYKSNTDKNYQAKSSNVIDQKLDSMILELWDTTTNKWVFDNKHIYTYNFNGKNTFDTYSEWDKYGTKWKNYSKSEYNYDSNDNTTTYTDYNWYESTNEWLADNKTEYNYNANGKDTLDIGFYWVDYDSLWGKDNKTEKAYDTKGNLILSIDYKYMFNYKYYQWRWSKNSKSEYTYDENGNKTLLKAYMWDNDSNNWKITDKIEYNNDANGNDTMYIYYSANDTSSGLEIVYKVVNTFDANKNNTSGTCFLWNGSDSQWIGAIKWEYTFDNLYAYLPYDFSVDNFKNRIIHATVYRYNGLDWFFDSKINFYYSSIDNTVIHDNYTSNDISVFPNPATDLVTFNLNVFANYFTIEIFDYLGRKMINQKLQNNLPVSVQNLPGGLYFYKLNDGKKLYTGKLLVK